MSLLKIPTATVDKLCILPPIGIPVGCITTISNVIKVVADVSKVALAAYRCRGSDKKSEATRVKLANAYNQSMQNFWKHLTFIVIGLLRIIPFVGGMMTWSYNSRLSNQMIEAGEKACKENKHQLALSFFEQAIAINGSSDVMLKIAAMYRDQKIEGKSKEEAQTCAFQWIKRAAGLGNSKAFCELGNCFFHGKGTAIAYEEALANFKKGAQKGDPDAQCNLGQMYADLQGVGAVDKEDHAKRKEFFDLGLAWLRKAAENGSGQAYYNLGLAYLQGDSGLPKSQEDAIEHFEKSANLGIDEAMVELADLYMALEKPKLEAAFAWLQKASEADNVEAQIKLGVIYRDASENRELPKKGIPSLKNSSRAQTNLLANYWLTKAANQDHALPHFYLAENYYYAKCGLSSVDNAIVHYERAIELGCPKAELKLGLIYSEEPFCKEEWAKQESVHLIEKAIANPHSTKEVIAEAKFVLAGFNEKGWGVKKSYQGALKLFQESAGMGFEPAKEKLKAMDRVIPWMKRKIFA